MKKSTLIILLFIGVAALAIVVFKFMGEDIKNIEENITENEEDYVIEESINDFEECAAAGNAIMESYPRQCFANGETFTEEIGNEVDKNDLIRLDYPRPNAAISSPLTITGRARGNWFFEAGFPVVLVDWDGLIIAEGSAEAQTDWMTEDFVPFEAKLEFENPGVYNNGALILQRSNPSDLPENDDALEIPVKFE